MYFRKLEAGVEHRELLGAYLKCISVYAYIYTCMHTFT